MFQSYINLYPMACRRGIDCRLVVPVRFMSSRHREIERRLSIAKDACGNNSSLKTEATASNLAIFCLYLNALDAGFRSTRSILDLWWGNVGGIQSIDCGDSCGDPKCICTSVGATQNNSLQVGSSLTYKALQGFLPSVQGVVNLAQLRLFISGLGVRFPHGSPAFPYSTSTFCRVNPRAGSSSTGRHGVARRNGGFSAGLRRPRHPKPVVATRSVAIRDGLGRHA